MADFKEALYEALLYSFGKILAKYNTFAQEVILRDVGREVIDYLDGHGFQFDRTGTVDDVNGLLELFIDNGFAEVERRPAEHGEIYLWRNLYGIKAYAALQEIVENPFLSCPLNASMHYLADKNEKSLKLYQQRFNLADNTAETHEEFVDKESAADSPFKESVVESARMYEIAERRAQKLEKTLSEVKKLQGLIPICAYCKKIRDDEGGWNQIESFIRDHSETEFSHLICPDCYERAIEDFKLQ
jgi:hypothetical protein